MTIATLEAAIHSELARTPHSTITHRAHTRYGTVYGYAPPSATFITLRHRLRIITWHSATAIA